MHLSCKITPGAEKVDYFNNHQLYMESLFPCVMVFRLLNHTSFNIVISVNRISVVWSCLLIHIGKSFETAFEML